MEEMRHERMHMADYDIMDDVIDTMMEVYDELDGAKKYIKAAISHKEMDRPAADSMVLLSAQELQHADTLTTNINRMFERMKTENHECYDVLHKVWTYIRERQMGYAAWIKQMHEVYKK